MLRVGLGTCPQCLLSLVKECGLPQRAAAMTLSPPSVLRLGNGILSGASDILQILCFFFQPQAWGHSEASGATAEKGQATGVRSLSRSLGQTALGFSLLPFLAMVHPQWPLSRESVCFLLLLSYRSGLGSSKAKCG